MGASCPSTTEYALNFILEPPENEDLFFKPLNPINPKNPLNPKTLKPSTKGYIILESPMNPQSWALATRTPKDKFGRSCLYAAAEARGEVQGLILALERLWG